MIFITPNTISNPADTAKRIAAVVTMSSSVALMLKPLRSNPVREHGVVHRPPPRASAVDRLPRLELRTLGARIHVLEGVENLHRPILLHLAEIHRQRRMVLLVHADGAARSVERNLS